MRTFGKFMRPLGREKARNPRERVPERQGPPDVELRSLHEGCGAREALHGKNVTV